MPLLKVGKTKLHYEVRYSERAKKRRIVVTPEKIEVVAPVGESLDEIAKLVQAKRRWIYDKHQQVNENLGRMMDTAPSRFISGAKVLYRGRLMKLRVRHRKNCKPSVKYRGGFVVQMPTGSSEDDVRQLVEEWMFEKVRQDIDTLIRKYGEKIGVSPNGLRIQDFKRIWGSCSKANVISLNWRLVHAPSSVLEYAVVHELCHLIERSHSDKFWSLVRSYLPNFESARATLDKFTGGKSGL